MFGGHLTLARKLLFMTTAHDLYRSPARLPDRRAHRQDLDPERLVALGWAEFLQGHSGRAATAMRDATRRAPDRPFSALNAYLLDDLVRGRRGRPQALRAFSRKALAAGDHEAWLLAGAHALAEAHRHGRPGPRLLASWDRLAQLAVEAGARLAPELALRAARAALGLGRLAEAEARARAVARKRPRGCEIGIRARLITRITHARRTGAHPVHPRGLEDLHPLHRLETLLTLADCSRRGGDSEAAEDYLARAARVAAPRQLREAATAISLARATLALDRRDLGASAELLAEAEPCDAPSRARHSLLEARLAASRGDPASAEACLDGCREDIERQAWCAGVQDLALLEAELADGDTLRHWRRARRWEDGEARLAMLTTLLPRVRDRTTFRQLWRDRPADPRTSYLRQRVRGRFDGPVPRDVRGRRIQRLRPPEPTWDLLLDLERRRATARETVLDLRRSERTMRLLEALLTHREGLCVEALTTTVWDRERIPYETDQLVHSAVYRLRNRLPDPELIEFTAERYRLAPDATVRLVGSRPPAQLPK